MGKPALIFMQKVRKIFGDLVALNDVDFSVEEGEVHGLLGENGAGKSTLMNILYGLYQPTSGDIFIGGDKMEFSSPADSIKHGVGMIHQISTLVPTYTAVENIILGTPSRSFDLKKEESNILNICEKYGFSFPLQSEVGQLPMGVRQKIEIVRALYRRAKVLILDEPTTCLVESEFDQLKNSLRHLAEKGIACVFISHKIREVREVCQRATILRSGRVEGVVNIADSTKDELVKMMFSEKNIEISDSALPIIKVKPSRLSEKPVCRIRDIYVKSRGKSSGLNGFSLEIYGGEIVGVAGVSGNGQKELAASIIKPSIIDSGEVIINGRNTADCSTLDIFKQGVGFIPEDRIKEAILPEASLVANLILPHFSEKQFRSHKLFINWSRAATKTGEIISDFNVATPGIKTEINRLSGGNIQKIILGRTLMNPVELLLAFNPCSGLDISTVQVILNKLVEIRDAGQAVLWINEDLDELMICSDRIAVIYNGEMKGVLPRHEFDKYAIANLMTGGDDESEQER